MADMMFALGQTKKKKTEENKVRQTKKDLKDVTITHSIEKDIRKEHHEREQKWKADGRDQIKQNTNFDMARSLFGGGGGPAPAAAVEEEQHDVAGTLDDEVVAAVEKLAVHDDEQADEDEESGEDEEGHEYQEEEEEYDEDD